MPPEDGILTPETCRGLRHNKVMVDVKVYYVGYVIVINFKIDISVSLAHILIQQ
jgi:hypothetical protein